MSFVQVEFITFMLIVFAVYWALTPWFRVQNVFLFLASAVFYGWVHPWFLILMYASSTLDYCAGIGITRKPAHKKVFLVASLVGNLGLLGFFKYFDFFVENVAAVLQFMGLHPSIHTLGIFLPVGISFYTFQSISYTVDVYRGDIKARTNFLDYQLFVTFFPHLVAGPINRADALLVQCEAPRRWDTERFVSGISLAMWGAFIKVCIADTVAPYVNRIFLMPNPDGPLVIAATFGFAVQVLTDFSGYSFLARGTARMLGFELMNNFNHPYLSKTPAEHWRRFHISFTTWIKDYLFVPLGGSKGTRWGTLKAQWISMLLSGLWHGAGWNYIIWGAYQAFIISAHREARRAKWAFIEKIPGRKIIQVPIQFCLTCVGYRIFREPDWRRLGGHFHLSYYVSTLDHWIASSVLVSLCVVSGIFLSLAMIFELRVWPRIKGTPWALPLQTTLWTCSGVGLFLFTRMTANDFIYFQF